MKNIFPKIEIMAPAGSYESLSAAIRAGADAIYFGTGNLNMRSRAAAPFQLGDIRKIARICRWCGVRSYLALNTIMYDEDLPHMREICDAARAAGITAVIATDIAAVQYAHTIGLRVHMSVQANVSNMDAVRFYARYAEVMVLARELSLAQITSICRAVREEHLCGPSGQPVRLELFVHGALCVAVSGKCYMSLAQYNYSANRGACLQPCRRRYRVSDDETGDELLIDNHFVMSPKDLCTIDCLDRILATGVSILKIEGRGRVADYVGTVTRVYREAVEAIHAGTYTVERVEDWKNELKTVFNRGFWHGGYYCGETTGAWSGQGHSQATLKREQMGVVTNFFRKPGVVEFTLWKAFLRTGDHLLFEGATTGAFHHTIDEMRVDEKTVREAKQGDVVTIALPGCVRRRDKVFLLLEHESGDPRLPPSQIDVR